jgi:hypothetical protein
VWYWDGTQWLWVQKNMSDFQKAMIALVISVMVLVIVFIVIRAKAPCAIPLGSGEQAICALQEELQDYGPEY